MQDPISRLFESFSDWVEKRQENFKKDKEDSKKELKRDWYKPKDEGKTVRDRDDITNMFKRDDIQKVFIQWIKGEGVVIDGTIIRFQNGFIAADERAFRLRHQTVPRAIAHGQLVHDHWVEDGMRKQFYEYIQTLLDRSKEDKKIRLTPKSTSSGATGSA